MPINLPSQWQYDGKSTWLPFINTFPAVDSDTLPLSMTNSLIHVVEKSQELLTVLLSPLILSNSVIRKRLLVLRDNYISARQFVTDEAKKSSVSLHPAFIANPLDEFNIYDNYFGVLRADGLSFAIFVDQYFNLTCRALDDISDSSLSLETVISLVTGFNLMGRYLLKLADPLGRVISKEIPYVSMPTAIYDDTKQKALARWKIQHYIFNIFIIFSENAFTKAIQAITNEDFETAESFIIAATGFFRGSTVAMVAASTFSSTTYKEIVRPSMTSVETPGGFSGTQNRDFESWRITKNTFRNLILTNKDVQTKLIECLGLFYDVYISDMEEHITITRAMRVKSSIVEGWYEKKFGIRAERRAVDSLLQRLDERKKEFEFLFTHK